MNYKLGLVSVSFRSHSTEDIVREMNKAGLTYIEWGSDVHAPVDKTENVAALQKKYGIECCSYGTYFRLGTGTLQELSEYIRGAKNLGTSVIRVWCGNRSDSQYTPREKQELFDSCRKAAAMAMEERVTLCLECHNDTYTQTLKGALEVINAVNMQSLRMYWQPNQYTAKDVNLRYAEGIAPYTEHIHVFNWHGDDKLPLQDATDQWREYLACFPGSRHLLLEFMPDGNIESLCTEAAALRNIVEV